jgi:3-deoxy-manno-octulosonate cytidylyltransferase (CMP-KDO synthetase)
MAKIIAIIPARMASTRFPGKPIVNICGKPMIEHVWRRVKMNKSLDEVVIATCDDEIKECAESFGAKVIMTSYKHERCTDRIAEAMNSIEADIIVNVQGDEPLIVPQMIDALIAPFVKKNDLVCTNLMSKISSESEFESPDVVKVVVDKENNAIYFSREPIPSRLKAGGMLFDKYKQLGVIAFRNDFLNLFAHLEPTPLEKVESVDMLRAIEHGYKVHMVLVDHAMVGVDTPADLKRAEELMRGDKLAKLYLD